MNKLALPTALAAGGAFCLWQNNGLERTQYTFASPRVPEAFDGFRILQISDLHNKVFGRGQRRLLKALEELSPQLIVVTGDLIDKRRTTPDTMGPALDCLAGAARIAPTFYVAGNHEEYCGFYPQLRQAIRETGAVNLDWKRVSLTRQGQSIGVMGAADPNFFRGPADPWGQTAFARRLLALAGEGKEFTILLSHRPELGGLYAQAGVDLAFCGHAHGGQLRLPGVGAVLSPGQGLFPRHTQGLTVQNGRGMVVSRGLGNSLFPQRIGNRPELVAVTLRRVFHKAEEKM